MALIAAHLVIAIRFALENGMHGPVAEGLTWAGQATIVLAVGTLALAVARAALLLPAVWASRSRPPEPPLPASAAP
jgi:hypothetical protein